MRPAGAGAASTGTPDREVQEAAAATLLQPRVRTSDPAFAPLYAAVRARRAVTFDYRKNPSGPVEPRRCSPGVWCRTGVVGTSSGMTRIAAAAAHSGCPGSPGPVKAHGRAGAVRPPDGIDLLAEVAAMVERPADRTATVRVRPGRAAGLRRFAVTSRESADAPGWDRLTIPLGHLWDTARRIAANGPDVVVEEPADLVDATVRVLTGTLKELAQHGQVQQPSDQPMLGREPASHCSKRLGRTRPRSDQVCRRSRRRVQMSETATDRLARMLALVPWISRRPGVAIGELATEFGVSTEQIGADLDLLMVCGLPGYYPDDLIDVVLDDDGGTVSIAFDAGIEQPVRLTADEAFALTVALRALAELPGLVDAQAVHSALSKLRDGERPGDRRHRCRAGRAGRSGSRARVGPAGAGRKPADLDPVLHRVPRRGHRAHC